MKCTHNSYIYLKVIGRSTHDQIKVIFVIFFMWIHTILSKTYAHVDIAKRLEITTNRLPRVLSGIPNDKRDNGIAIIITIKPAQNSYTFFVLCPIISIPAPRK